MVRGEGRPDPIPVDEPLVAVEPPVDLGAAVRTGIKWKVATQVLGEGTRVLVTFILARLLTPSDYGVAGIAIVCTTFTHIFVDPGLGTALVQRRSIDETDRSTVFWTTAAVGLLFTGGGIAASGLVADAFGVSEVRKLFMVLSLTFVLNALSVPQMALLNRALAYRSLEVREMIATLTGAIVAVACAFAGFGPWAIVMNFFVFSLVSTALVWRLSSWRPRFLFGRDSFRDLGSFGMKLFWSRILMWGNFNADNVLVGKFLGSSALGAYSLAYNVMFMPMTRIGIPATQVLSPAYARLQEEPDRLEEAWLTAKRILSAILVPCFTLMLVVAPDLVHVAFGEKWDPAIAPLQLLCVAGAAHALVAMDQSVLQAIGKGGTLVRLNILLALVTLASFACGLPFGVSGVAGAYAIARWLLAPIDLLITARNANIEPWKAIAAGFTIIPLSAVAGGAAFGLRFALHDQGVGSTVRLVAAAAVFAGAYAILLRSFQPRVAGEIGRGLRRRPGPQPA
jgi:O-antigen/teichoic acid export membrane protein